jgi:hypothetical protein
MTQPPIPEVVAAGPGVAWRRFVVSFGTAAFGLAMVLWAFVVWVDPYGLRAAPGKAAVPIMDVNQRFMYPQLARGGRFDAAVFGTSTVRLLDPVTLDRLFEARFANLGLNAGTPWEQVQLARLFLRHVPHPRTVIFGIDLTWCEADADTPAKRLTFRTFPNWLYDENASADVFHLFTAHAAELAFRVGLYRVGLAQERIRGDGYERFVPPDGQYDLERARTHIWGPQGRGASPVEAAFPPRATEGARAEADFPALAWLDDLLAGVSAGTDVMLVFPPTHVATQSPPRSAAAEREAACKEQVAELGARHGAVVVDFRMPSSVTTEDSNYWDPLHYRIAIAERLAAALKVARDTRRDDKGGFYRVLSAPQAP